MWFLTTAFAGTLVGAVGAADIATGQVLTGAELSVLGDQVQGFRPHFRLLAGIDPIDVLPTGTTELGFTGVVPAEENATIRAGVFARVDHLVRRRRLAVQIGSADEGTPRYGFGFSGAALAELAWTPEAPMVLGGHLGFGHWSSIRPECIVDEDPPPGGTFPERCVAWPVSIIAGAHFRKSLKNGLSFRATVGTTFEAGVGYRFK